MADKGIEFALKTYFDGGRKEGGGGGGVAATLETVESLGGNVSMATTTGGVTKVVGGGATTYDGGGSLETSFPSSVSVLFMVNSFKCSTNSWYLLRVFLACSTLAEGLRGMTRRDEFRVDVEVDVEFDVDAEYSS